MAPYQQDESLKEAEEHNFDYNYVTKGFSGSFNYRDPGDNKVYELTFRRGILIKREVTKLP